MRLPDFRPADLYGPITDFWGQILEHLCGECGHGLHTHDMDRGM